MCGIAGIVEKDNLGDWRSLLSPMLSVMSHRGPDAEGVWSDTQVALGHRRLSIIDTSEDANQPMHYNSLTIVYNGEIYNYLELREELQRLGHLFVTKSDTEVILHAYEAWAEKCVNHFRGMWAFAIFDNAKRQLFLSRDRFGIKPLYYRLEENRFFFSSEIKALLQCYQQPKAQLETVVSYLLAGLEDYSQSTFFKDILQVPAGTNMHMDVVNWQIAYSPYYDVEHLSLSSASADKYASDLRDSVRLHLRSDVPVGTCLSGGLDSSTVAGLAAAFLSTDSAGPLNAITASSEDPSRDETNYAAEVAEHCKLNWHPIKPRYDDFKEHIEDCLYFLEEPVVSASVFLQYWVMKKAKEIGLKVMLDGQGGDETLLGYERYYIALFRQYFQRLNWLRLSKEIILCRKNSGLKPKDIMLYMLYFSNPFIRLLWLNKKTSFLKQDYIAAGLSAVRANSVGFNSLSVLQQHELKYQLPHLLKYEDRNSMAHSIEARVPFLDHVCVETAMSMPETLRIHNGFTKHALRLLAEKVLPAGIAWRRNKIGFEGPEALWLKKHASIINRKIEDSALLRTLCRRMPRLEDLHPHLRWRLYNLSVWEGQYNVQL